MNTLTSSCIGFLLISRFLKHFNLISYLNISNKRQAWLWRNTFCSLVHSTLSSVWTLVCYFDEPNLLHDMINTSSHIALSLIMFSTGYFIYDYIDVLLHDKFRQWELLCHHTAVLVAFTIAITNNKYIGFAVCALLMEFNSIFLHIRRLMRMSQFEESNLYSVNCVFLMLTMVFLRFCTSAWMMRWLLRNNDLIPRIPYIVGLIGMSIIIVTNIGLMYRLCVSDLGKKRVMCLKNELTK